MAVIESTKWKEAGWELEQFAGRLTAKLEKPGDASLTAWAHLTQIIVPRLTFGLTDLCGPTPGCILHHAPEATYVWTWGE